MPACGDHGRTRQSRHQPVPREEPVLCQRGPWWQLAHQQTGTTDLTQQVVVLSRVGTVQTAR